MQVLYEIHSNSVQRLFQRHAPFGQPLQVFNWGSLAHCSSWGKYEDTVWYGNNLILLQPLYLYSLGHLEAVLKDQFKSVEFKDTMENVEDVCHLEHHGSTTLKEIQLLVNTSDSLIIGLYQHVFRDLLVISLTRGTVLNFFDSRVMDLLRRAALTCLQWRSTSKDFNPPS